MLVEAGRLDDLPSERCVSIADGRAVVVRTGTDVRAFPNRCLHQESPLDGGWVRDGVLSCPLHFWRYRVADGSLIGGGADDALEQLPVTVDDGDVTVELPELAPAISLRQQLLARASTYDRADAHAARLDTMRTAPTDSPHPADQPTPYDVLLLDFGGVCLVNPVERHSVVEEHFGLEPGTLTWMGPLDVEGDELYARSLTDGAFTEREYWEVRAGEVGRRAGVDLDTFGYMHAAYSQRSSGDSLIRPEAVEVCERARAAGIGVSVLTNDLHAFHDEEWVSQIDFLNSVDHLIDCSHLGFLKPDPRAYELALTALRSTRPNLPADRVLFVDDRPLNVDGADSSGMHGMFFDIAAAGSSWQRVADRLGL